MNGLADGTAVEDEEALNRNADEKSSSIKERENMLSVIEEIINLPDELFKVFTDELRISKGDKGRITGEALYRERKI